MKAIVCTRYGPPEVLKLKELPCPNAKETEVCIRVRATSVTASDCIIRGFRVPPAFWLPMAVAIGFGKPRKSILGMVFSGEVSSIGGKVLSFKEGDKVFGFDRYRFGCYAQYKCISEKGLMTVMPASLSYVEAAAIPYGGLLASSFIGKGRIKGGQRVLIYGASGAVGTAAVQIAKAKGAEVTAVCGTAHVSLVLSLGADRVIDYSKTDSLESAGSYDIAFDAVGKRKSSALKRLIAQKMKGRYLSVDDGAPKLSIEDLRALKELVAAGKMKAVIDKVFALEQVAEAHSYVEQGHKSGNVVITVG
jgi:NADPH:quinone reductase-like Zn-dependent oxidoreductase